MATPLEEVWPCWAWRFGLVGLVTGLPQGLGLHAIQDFTCGFGHGHQKPGVNHDGRVGDVNRIQRNDADQLAHRVPGTTLLDGFDDNGHALASQGSNRVVSKKCGSGVNNSGIHFQ